MRINIPDIAEDLTADWLNRTLQDAGAITISRVTACSPTPFGEGVGFVSRIFRLAITYDSKEPGAPDTLVVKLHSKHPQNDRYWGAPGRNVYEKEQRFYKTVAKDVRLRTPRCYLAETDWEQKRSLLLFEDLAPTRPGDQLAGCSAEDMATITRDLARFNAGYWESDRLDRIEGCPALPPELNRCRNGSTLPGPFM